MAFEISVDDLYIVVLDGMDSKVPERTKVTGAANIIGSAEQLPPGPLLVASPPVANHLAGTVPLYACVHPKDAIYVFGADNISLTPAMFGARTIDQVVYIPCGATNLNSHVAAAMIFYDRRYKEWLTKS
jgi:hypothetical protein